MISSTSMRITRSCFKSCNRYASTGTRSPNSISFIGLGRMGSEMAFNLFSKQYASEDQSAFVVCDAVPEAAHSYAENFQKHFPAAQVRIVNTPEEAVTASRTVITMLPSSPHVQRVYTEAGGILSGLKSLQPERIKDTLCIDSTTLDVEVARKVAAEISHTGAKMLDAPVSGGVTGAKAGTLSFLVGGTDAAFGAASPILSLMGKRIIHCGPTGSGLVAKICNNLMLGVEQIVTAEAMLLGQRLGVKANVLAEVINSSTGGCWSSRVNNPVPAAVPEHSPPSERGYEGGFATALMLKDMGLAVDSARLLGTPLPLGCLAEQIYKKVIEIQPDLTRKDFSSVYKYLEEREGEDVLARQRNQQ